MTFSSQSWSFPGFVTPLHIRAGQGAFVDHVLTHPGGCSGVGCGTGAAVLGTTGIIAGANGDHLLAAHQTRALTGPAGAQATRIYTCSGC
jgi:hypothetical protein